ncbi:hypothetical protein ACLOJK_011565 [Asimina triloba]
MGAFLAPNGYLQTFKRRPHEDQGRRRETCGLDLQRSKEGPSIMGLSVQEEAKSLNKTARVLHETRPWSVG